MPVKERLEEQSKRRSDFLMKLYPDTTANIMAMIKSSVQKGLAFKPIPEHIVIDNNLFETNKFQDKINQATNLGRPVDPGVKSEANGNILPDAPGTFGMIYENGGKL